eukprot:GHVR01116719.1.p1 GENE.GHVR01116719.1~~GHVR01116719.1.p1  ORF type:complete len:199 (-),score=42.76 GHVR01116719.1:41-637(-)
MKDTFAEVKKLTPSTDRYGYMWATLDTQDASALDCTNSTDKGTRINESSCPQVYTNSTWFTPFPSLVVNLNNGLVDSMIWDNRCNGVCSTNDEYSEEFRCLQSARAIDIFPTKTPIWSVPNPPNLVSAEVGVCGHLESECEKRAGEKGTNACDMSVWVTFSGKSRGGNFALSAGTRFSRFPSGTVWGLQKGALEKLGK